MRTDRSSIATVTRVVMAALALALLATGCGTKSPGRTKVDDQSLTDKAAREQIYSYLAETLGHLPDGLTWSLKSDWGRAEGSPGSTNVCSDSDGANSENSPVQVGVTYWLNGVPRGHEHEMFQAVIDAWRKLGWREIWSKENSAAYSADGKPGGYAFSVDDAANGPGSVSVSGTSPCFWSKNDNEIDPPLQQAQPKVIRRSKAVE